MNEFIRLDATLERARTPQEIAETFQSYLRECGYKAFVMIYQIFEHYDHPPLLVYTNYPPDWLDYYMQNHCYGVDPVRLCMIDRSLNPRPLFWSVYDDWGKISGPETVQFMNDVREQGVECGVAIPFALQRGRGVLNLPVGIGAENPSLESLAKVVFSLAYFHQHVLRVHTLTTPDSPLNVRITPRERAVYELVADGMTSKQIGAKLRLTPRTVDSHINSVQEKLGAENRTQALCKAINLGLVTPTDYYRTPESVQFFFAPKAAASPAWDL